MKIKLLRKVRKKIRLEYFPSIGEYRLRLRTGVIMWYDDKSMAKSHYEDEISTYCRENYSKYAKSIRV